MASRKDLANKYFKRISNSLNPEREIRAILQEINNLTYSETGKTISKEEKAKIVLLINELLDEKYSEYFNFIGGEKLNEQQEIEKAFSNNNYLDLIAQIKARTKK